MRDLRVRRLRQGRQAGTAFVLAGLVGLSTASFAGTGRLLSQLMSRAPAIDGQITAGEWSEAKLVDLGAGVTVRIGNDARTLYLAVLDSADPIYTSNDSVGLLFDGGPVVCLPDCSTVSDPSDYRNLVLASGGCNTGVQDFGSGDPQIGLPLDWTNEIIAGGGPVLFADGFESGLTTHWSADAR